MSTVLVLSKKRLHAITDEEFLLSVRGDSRRWHVVRGQKRYNPVLKMQEIQVMSRQGGTKWFSAQTMVSVVGNYNAFIEGKQK